MRSPMHAESDAGDAGGRFQNCRKRIATTWRDLFRSTLDGILTLGLPSYPCIHRPNWNCKPRRAHFSPMNLSIRKLLSRSAAGNPFATTPRIRAATPETDKGRTCRNPHDLCLSIVAQAERQVEPVEPLRREHCQILIPERTVMNHGLSSTMLWNYG